MCICVAEATAGSAERADAARADSGRTLARRAAQALAGFDGDEPRDCLPGAAADGFGASHAISASRMPRGCATGSPRSSRSSSGSTSFARLRELRACLVVPALEPGMMRAVFVAGAVVARRTVPRGGGAYLEIEAGLAEVRSRLARELEATPQTSYF